MNKIIYLCVAAAYIGFVFIGCAGDQPERIETEGSQDENIAVTVDTVKQATLHGYIVAYGTVQPEPGTNDFPPGSVRITAPVTGVVARVNCSEYQYVRESQTLFVFDTTIADAGVREARNALTTAEKALDRQKQMKEIDATSEKQFLEVQKQVEAARNALAAVERERALLEVKAPISGVVGDITVRIGETLNTADVMASLWNRNRLIVMAKVPGSEIGAVTIGQPVMVHATTDDSASGGIKGVVRAVGENIDSRNDAVDVLISLPADTSLLPGQFVKVAIAYAEHTDCLVVPSKSVVITSDGQATVTVVTGGMAVKCPVTVGFQENGLTEVSDTTLIPGTLIVVTGAYGLPDSSEVRIVEQ